ncbi:MAG: site-specific DNA-methyltransferase [Dehalococcoidia bacterium]|nr:site-specific DNA-methyltransferase [Dehalococcoidia bacterium]
MTLKGHQPTLLPRSEGDDRARERRGSMSEQLPRLDSNPQIRAELLPLCRLKSGEVWEDSAHGHRIGVLDSTDPDSLQALMGNHRANLAINDPPYNIAVGNANTRNLSKTDLPSYMSFSRKWVTAMLDVMATDAHFYLWTGADYRDNFQPLPDLMLMMRDFPTLTPKNFITVRNQRGYGTQDNWMWVRQELLHYTIGRPGFRVVYTDIPKILRGYYKRVNGNLTENMERSKSDTIRPGNVWVDIQQVFYRMEENVPGCYAQKPLAAIRRLIETSSDAGDVVVDGFAHSGASLIAAEQLGRTAFTCDIDPVFAEVAIRRLERYRETGETGWKWRNPFPEISKNGSEA